MSLLYASHFQNKDCAWIALIYMNQFHFINYFAPQLLHPRTLIYSPNHLKLNPIEIPRRGSNIPKWLRKQANSCGTSISQKTATIC